MHQGTRWEVPKDMSYAQIKTVSVGSFWRNGVM